MISVNELTVDYSVNPIGITKKPRFSWVLFSDEKNVFQKSYHIDISKDFSFENIIFTREEETDNSICHRFDELELESITKYYWRVKVVDNHGNESDYSSTGYFVTALINNNEWQGEFISAENENDADNSKGTYVKKEIYIDKKIKEAYVCATSLGLYQFMIDGVKIGDDEMTPGWTSYHKHLCYQMYEITDILNQNCKHEIKALLGAGYYKGKMGFFHLRNYYGIRTAFLAQIHIDYEDGTKDVIKTDDTWLGSDSPILFSEIYDGEIYDASLEGKEVYRKVDIVAFDKEVLTSQFDGKIAKHEVFKPKMIVTPKGEIVADFGQNMAGKVEIKLNNTSNMDHIEFQCFETLDSEGNVYTENLRSAKATIRYICKGSKEEIYTPHFTYMGFRYVWIKDSTIELDENNLTAYALYSSMREIGKFNCSNKDLNKLWSNINWSLKSNFFDIPTDCPQRDERLGWTGDAQIFCKTACYIMNTYLFFEKWLLDVAYDQTSEGGVPHVVPDIITPSINKSDDWLLSQGTHSAAAWADVAVLNPWNMYLAYGDKSILVDQYESMKAWINFMEKHSKGLIWNYKLQFGDWVALDAKEGSYYGATPNELTCTAYFYYSTNIFSKIAKIVGRDYDADYYEALAKKIKDVFCNKFFDKATGKLNVHTQTAHIVALYFGLTAEESKQIVVDDLLKLLDKENGHLVTGFIGTPYFTHVLSQNGHLKEAYELLMKDDFPSWLYQVKNGATTIWEHWDGMKPDGTMWSADMNSFNHYAYGSIGEWLVRTIIGLQIDEKEPGYKAMIIHPQPGANIDSAEGALLSSYGKISCEWSKKENEMTVKILVPVGTKARFILDNVVEVKRHNFDKLTIEENRLTSSVASGEYEIVVTLGDGVNDSFFANS